MNTALCPPLGQDFTVEGKVSGDIFKVFRVLVDRCNPATDLTCMSDAAFAATEAAAGMFNLVIPIVNTNVNPGSSVYKEYYLGD